MLTLTSACAENARERMRLYYLTNAEYGLSDLREKHLKIARIDQLNDPFEFMCADLSNDDLRKEIEALKD